MERRLDEIAETVALIATDMAKMKSDYRKVEEKLAKIDGLEKFAVLNSVVAARDHEQYNDITIYRKEYPAINQVNILAMEPLGNVSSNINDQQSNI